MQQARTATIPQALEYYSKFIAYTDASTVQGDRVPVQQEILPTLSELTSAPDSALFTAIGPVAQAFDSTAAASSQSEAQFSVPVEVPNVSAAECKIDWDISAHTGEGVQDQADQSSAAVVIDWDVDLSTDTAALTELNSTDVGTAVDIDWDIDVTAEDAEASEEPSPAEQHAQGSGSAALQEFQGWIVHYMDDTELRNKLHNDLHELVVRTIVIVCYMPNLAQSIL